MHNFIYNESKKKYVNIDVKYKKIVTLKEYERLIKIRRKIIMKDSSKYMLRHMLLAGDIERNPGMSHIL